ncbi:TPA: fibronectin type III domain-containing protein [Bacillus paranthracis]
MRVKKYLAIFSLMMIMCLSVLPSFASAEKINLIEGKKGFLKDKTPSESLDSNGNPFIYVTDGSESTSNVISNSRVYFDLGDNVSMSSFYYSISGQSEVASIFFYDKNNKLIFDYSLGVNASAKESKKKLDNVKYVVVASVGKINIHDLKVFYDDGKISNVSSLESKPDVNKVEFSWVNPTEENFSGVKIYEGDTYLTTVDKPLNTYTVSGLKDSTTYSFRFTTVDDNGIETKGINKAVTTLIDPKKIPPGPVSSFVADPTDKTVKLKWKRPKDEDLAGFKIFQNGKKIAEIGLEEEFTVKNLEPLTEYNFGVVAVDKDKNDSTSVNLSVKTLDEKDDEPPHVPSNVFAKPSNGALIASWDKVSDKDLAGYNVYLDDKKINSNLISSTNFTIKNLENNRKYKIQVQAVDRSGNVSELSLSAYGTPDENTVPIIESKYSLQDVSDGVSVMFGQFWTVLAFAVGIPLAFYIIYKLKLTVLP